MTTPPPDGSRDLRIEDPTNLWIIHPAGRLLLPWAVARGVSANLVSLIGLGFGILAAAAYGQWHDWRFALIGLALSVCWLVADGLDGMIARATGTASAVGRILDGVCDHGVFILIYVVIATSLGTVEGWALALTAGAAHIVQSSLYEGERARFHRRSKGLVRTPLPPVTNNWIVRGYDMLATGIDRVSVRFDALFEDRAIAPALAKAYAARAVGPMRLMILLTANIRVYAVFLACVVGNPHLFWWFEIVPLSIVTFIGVVWHRSVEASLVHQFGSGRPTATGSHGISVQVKDINRQ
jgi:hypothetical protein